MEAKLAEVVVEEDEELVETYCHPNNNDPDVGTV